jgi:hypothetical protein
LAVHPEDGRQSPRPGPASGSALCSPYSPPYSLRRLVAAITQPEVAGQILHDLRINRPSVPARAPPN